MVQTDSFASLDSYRRYLCLSQAAFACSGLPNPIRSRSLHSNRWTVETNNPTGRIAKSKWLKTLQNGTGIRSSDGFVVGRPRAIVGWCSPLLGRPHAKMAWGNCPSLNKCFFHNPYRNDKRVTPVCRTSVVRALSESSRHSCPVHQHFAWRTCCGLTR